jgi:hypothetical protein
MTLGIIAERNVAKEFPDQKEAQIMRKKKRNP